MREIKFRIWDISKMFYKCSVGSRNPSVYNRHNGFTSWKECTEDAVIMQYTGLKDKNGKEIYEGDIVKATGYGLVKTTFMSRIAFQEGCFGIIALEEPLLVNCEINKSFKSFDGCDTKELIEVIGNIYENPELLK